MPRKQPKRAYQPSRRKQPRGEPSSTADLTPIWSFALFDKSAVWHDEQYQEETFREVASHLKDYEGMTWGRIENRRRYNHPVPVERLITEAQKRLVEINLDDTDELWRFRLSGKRRIWGIRDRHIFKVLWWDPQHRICPSQAP